MSVSHNFRLKARPFFRLILTLGVSLLLFTNALALANPLPVDQVAQIAYDAGFRGDSLITAIAIGWAESSFIPDNINTTGNYPVGSRDRGIWQINDAAHPEVKDACAFSPVCAAGQTYRISSGGTNWGPWTTYNGTRYNQYLPTAQAAAAKFNINNGSDTDIWVDGGYSGTQTGTQANPYSTVQAAVNRASATQAVVIHIKPGTYSEKIVTSRHIQFVTNGPGTVRIGG